MKNSTTGLFVSDLDGTLLQSDGTLSDYTRQTLKDLLKRGVHFTVASARAWGEMTPVLGDLPLDLPVIAINGAYLTDYATGNHLVINAIENDFAATLYRHILDGRLYPFVVTHNGTEDCLYWQNIRNEQMQWYHDILHVHTGMNSLYQVSSDYSIALSLNSTSLSINSAKFLPGC